MNFESSNKRSAEYNEDSDCVIPKVFKKMEDDDSDVTLDSSALSPDLKCSLEYDFMLKSFSVLMEKERKDGNRSICFGEEEIEQIIQLLPAIEKLVLRYSSKRSPVVIDFPFEASGGEVGDLITLLSLKENGYKRGHFDIDIRKCFRKEDGFYQYTSEGVRFAQNMIDSLKKTLLSYQSLIKTAKVKSKEVILMSLGVVLIREINELGDPRQHCQGCQIQHPSQEQHMSYGGCLVEQDWDELCNRYWQAARALVTDEYVQELAKRGAFRLPELKKSFMPRLLSSNDIPDCEVKDLVLRKDDLEQDPFFKILNDVY